MILIAFLKFISMSMFSCKRKKIVPSNFSNNISELGNYLPQMKMKLIIRKKYEVYKIFCWEY